KGSSSSMRICRPGRPSAAREEGGEAGRSSSAGAAIIFKSAERRTGPSLGTSENALPSKGRVSPVNRLAKLCQRNDPSRTDQLAAMASLERVRVVPSDAAWTEEACSGVMARATTAVRKRQQQVRRDMQYSSRRITKKTFAEKSTARSLPKQEESSRKLALAAVAGLEKTG